MKKTYKCLYCLGQELVIKHIKAPLIIWHKQTNTIKHCKCKRVAIATIKTYE